jgi:hypothetical protein
MWTGSTVAIRKMAMSAIIEMTSSGMDGRSDVCSG